VSLPTLQRARHLIVAKSIARFGSLLTVEAIVGNGGAFR
jgi:hypothetical protein